MAEEVKAVHREPHPFIGIQHINQFVGKPVAFVGRIDRFEDNNLFMKTHEGKSHIPTILRLPYGQKFQPNEKCAKPPSTLKS